MDAVGQEQVKRQTEKSAFPFDFGLMVQTAKPGEEKEKGEKPEEKLERLPVLVGMRKYAAEHVLLVGRPGSGKSTALIRMLLEEAENKSAAAKIPVLVELRYWRTGVIDRILTVLQQGNYLNLDAETLKTWLRQGRLLLLMDGLNELPSEEARRDVATFRRDYLQTPMIFTTRELSVGGDLGIAKKLEMQPLTEAQMQEFVRAYLPPNQAEQMLRQLKDRLRELGQTPLLLWMLCGLFQRLGIVPPNLGMVFRQFTQGYERSLKDDIPVTAESRRWWSLLLQRLAFAMMQGENPQEKPTELQVTIAHQTAEDILTQYLTEEKFDKPRDFAKQWLEDLLKHHLIQINGDKIEFRHQLIQEYYAAEYLLRQLPKLSDAALQRQYLNYLKWTEAIALMLGLVEDEAQAVRVVELAIGVELMLGARLAGKVKTRFQKETVGRIANLKVIVLLKSQLLGKTMAEVAIDSLSTMLKDTDSYVQETAAKVLGNLGSKEAIPVLLNSLQDKDGSVRAAAAEALGKLNSELAIPGLLVALRDESSFVRARAALALGELSIETAIPNLLITLQDEIPSVRWRATEALGKVGNRTIIPALLLALHDINPSVRAEASKVLGELGDGTIIPELFILLRDEKLFVRKSAAKALDKLGNDTVRLFFSGWLDEDSTIHWNTEVTIAGLLAALQDSNSSVRRDAIEMLCRLEVKTSVPQLLVALHDEDCSVRAFAAGALGELGDKTVILELLDALHDEEYVVQREACEALGRLRSEIAIPGLLAALQDRDSLIYVHIMEALGELGSEAAIPALLIALRDEDTGIQWNATKALEKLRGDQKDILSPLWNLVQKTGETHIISAIASIQARCKFYNYEIFQAAQSSPPKTIPQSSPSLIVQGDYIAGDKVEGDKAMGDKVTGNKNIHNVETVGNLNTGTVNVQGDQIGSQNNSDGKA